MDIQVGDILTMKKQHPCGEKRWEVLRIGADFKLRCLGCGREVMGAREVRENGPADRPERGIKNRRTCPPVFLYLCKPWKNSATVPGPTCEPVTGS